MTRKWWSFFVLQVCRVIDVKHIHTATITQYSTQQLSRVTLYVKITWPRAWPFVSFVLMTQKRWSFFLFCRFLESGMSKIYNSTQQLSRVSLYVKVTWPRAWPFVSLVLMTQERWFFCRFLGSGMSNMHSYLVRYIYLKNLTPIKIHRSGFSGTCDEKGHA